MMNVWKFALYLSSLTVVLSDKGLLSNDSKHFQESDFLRLLPNHGKDLFVKKDLHDLVQKLVSSNKKQDLINKFVDDTLQRLAIGVDAVALEDVSEEFARVIGMFTLRGNIELTDGTLQGLAAVERAGDVIVSLQDKTVNLHMNLIYSQLKFTYNYSAELVKLRPSGHVNGTISPSKITVDIQISPTTSEAKLTNFELDEMGKISVRLERSILKKLLAYILRDVITEFVEPDLKSKVHDFIQTGTVALIKLYNSMILS